LKNIDKKHIFEFDLKGFFDNVDLEVLKRKMKEELCYPPDFCDFIKKMNMSLIDLRPNVNSSSDFAHMFEKEPELLIRYTPELTVNPNLNKKYQPKRNKG